MGTYRPKTSCSCLYYSAPSHRRECCVTERYTIDDSHCIVLLRADPERMRVGNHISLFPVRRIISAHIGRKIGLLPKVSASTPNKCITSCWELTLPDLLLDGYLKNMCMRATGAVAYLSSGVSRRALARYVSVQTLTNLTSSTRMSDTTGNSDM